MSEFLYIPSIKIGLNILLLVIYKYNFIFFSAVHYKTMNPDAHNCIGDTSEIWIEQKSQTFEVGYGQAILVSNTRQAW